MTDLQDSALRRSITEGCIAAVMSSLAGGALLTGFALYLGASDFQIGLLSSLPPLITIIQLATHWLLRKYGDRKKLTVWMLGMGRAVWLVIIMLPILFHNQLTQIQFAILLIIIILASGFNSIGTITWWSWMSDLVPHKILGQYFSRRNLWTGIVSMLVFYLASISLDYYKNHVPDSYYGYGFSGIFLFALLFGLISINMLRKIPDIQQNPVPQNTPALKELLQPLRDRNFRHFIIERSFWAFSVCFAAPFFNVYLLKNLNADWSFIALLNIISTAAALYCIRFWGRIADKFGNKPLMSIACMVKTLFPLMWLFVTPTNYRWILIPTNFLCAFDSAITLTSSNLSLKLSPRGNNTAYLSTYVTIFNLSCAASPLLGGWMMSRFAPTGFVQVSHFGLIDGLKILFFLSAFTRLLTAWSLERLHEPNTRTVRYMFRVLKEVKGFIPTVSEPNQALQFWFNPVGEMLFVVRKRGKKLTLRIKDTITHPLKNKT